MIYLCLAQGFYYLVSGVWPLLRMRSFEAVTGPKVDDWLVKTVGLLIVVVGAVLILSGLRGRVPLEVAVLAGGSALALAGVDVWYVMRKVIPPVYLLDALVELPLAAAWTAAWILST
jgi:hypothetical protein